MTAGRADGAHINVNSSFHTLTHQLFVTKRGERLPEFLDEFWETGDEVCAVLMKSFDVFFVLVCRIDNGDFGEVVHVGAVGLIALTGHN